VPGSYGTGLGSGRIFVWRKDEPLAALPRIDAEHGRDGNENTPRHATKTRIEADFIIAHRQIAGRGVAEVERDPPVLDVLLRHRNTGVRGINHQIGRLVVVDHPLVQRPQQVRALGRQGRLRNRVCQPR
jgi:hypothetical protein